MDPLIRNLISFQDLSLEVSRLDARLSQIPADLKAIDDSQSAAASSITKAKARGVESGKRKRELEKEVQDLEGKISKYNDQSRDVKTNEQYRAILHEIEHVKTKIGEVEEKILLAMEEIDASERQIRDEEKALLALKPEFDARRSVLTAEKQRLTAERARLAAERDEASRLVPVGAMEVYVRATKSRGGSGMARAKDERCSGCNVRIRPQTVAHVRKNDQIIQCESCTRILYYIDERPASSKDAGSDDAGSPPEAQPA